MPLSALNFYLVSKYNHEKRQEVYLFDALYSMVTHKVYEEFPRWQDYIKKSKSPAKAQDYEVSDVIDMFRGRGILR